MEKDKISKKVISKLEESIFISTVRHDSTEIVQWLKIVDFKRINLSLGLSKNGLWLRKGPHDVFEFLPGERLVFLLPCLEIPRSEFFSRLEASLKLVGLPESLVDTFPLEDLILTALDSFSEHWTRNVLTWITESDFTPKIIIALSQLSSTEDERISKKIKHGASKILDRIKK